MANAANIGRDVSRRAYRWTSCYFEPVVRLGMARQQQPIAMLSRVVRD